MPLLYRHIRGDWGDIPEQDVRQNELALILGMRIWSSYNLPNGKTIWIITSANRAITQIMLADGDSLTDG